MADKIYPNTAQGAKQALVDMCDHMWASPERIFAARAIRDPEVEGVWGLKGVSDVSGETDAIVYLAGYAEVFGGIRTQNDFEPGSLR